MTIPGLPNPWVLLGVLIAWGASLAAAGMWQNDVGHTEQLAADQKREIAELAAKNVELAKARAQIEQLNKDKDAIEQRHAAELAITGAEYEAKVQDLEDQGRRDAAAARAGALKLRVAGMCASTPARGAGGQAAASAAPAGRDGAADGELPGSVTQDLLDLSHDADQVTDQLAACQRTVLAYYHACSTATTKGASP